MKHYLEVSIYKMFGKRFPRLAVFSADDNKQNGTGTRLYGGKYSDFPSEETYKIPLDEKLIDEIIFGLQEIKDKLGDEK